ncbi:hypothetical protein SDC9_103225 [bioreactor metagenome]|uniref:Uncharacterized protein n=1 Tax=bioreactor metagenome TaxID=1076179 RepID=A0A645AT26_9ZZZZ
MPLLVNVETACIAAVFCEKGVVPAAVKASAFFKAVKCLHSLDHLLTCLVFRAGEFVVEVVRMGNEKIRIREL